MTNYKIFKSGEEIELDIDKGFICLWENELTVCSSIYDENPYQKVKLPDWLAKVIRDALEDHIDAPWNEGEEIDTESEE